MSRLLASAVVAVSLMDPQLTVMQEAQRIPEPAGIFRIGRDAFDWTDVKRSDPFSRNPTARRELMVYIWYPTASPQTFPTASYLPGARQIDAVGGSEQSRRSLNWPLIVSGEIMSHAQEGAAPAPNPRRFPVVLFSHGQGTSSFAYTTAIEDFASHGYVVVAVEHPYSSSAVAYPDGRVIQSSDRPTLRGDRPTGIPYFDGVQIAMADMRQLNDIQASDLIFVLDQLARINGSERSSPFYGRLNLRRIAAVGHSLGGMTAVRACQRDRRIKACVNQDGGTADGVFLEYPDAMRLTQPFLYVEATPPLTLTDQQLAERGITREEWIAYATKIAETRDRQLRSGRKGSVSVELRAPYMFHMSFSDTAVLSISPQVRPSALHNLNLTISVTRAFLDKYLKDEKGTLLDAATPNSEITLRRYLH
jgi:pimeloyl-ACP methyl ester carboxylesterase